MERQCLWARMRISCFCLWVLGCLWLVGRGDTAWAQANTVRFAVIGDFGVNSQSEQDVADLVASWNPEFVLALGDNNYPVGAASTIDVNIGKYYHAFISPYLGTYGAGATENRFFPCLGNHDWAGTEKDKPYRDYFALPGNERYYDFVWGPVLCCAVDSDPHEPDGNTSTSVQAKWLQDRLKATTETWKLVYFHHPAYSSGGHRSNPWMQWPFEDWGATTILSGHDHDYERILRNGVPYFVNGAGGAGLYGFWPPVEGSQVRFDDDFGAMLVTATSESITFQFITRKGVLVDTYTAVTVAGKVQLEEAMNLAQPVRFEFRPMGGGTPIIRLQTLAQDGSFRVTNIPAGSYQVAIKGNKWLQRVVSVDVSNGPATGVSASLLAGDCNDDNVVGLDDLGILAEAFDTFPLDGLWNSQADLNCDGKVDLDDLGLLANNFDLVGE